jgi:hypothetical protein
MERDLLLRYPGPETGGRNWPTEGSGVHAGERGVTSGEVGHRGIREDAPSL